MLLDTRKRKIFAVIWAWFEIFLFAGMFFGWGSLVLMLKEDGIYGNLCEKSAYNETHQDLVAMPYSYPNTNQSSVLTVEGTTDVEKDGVTPSDKLGCPEQDKRFNLGFTISSGIWPFLFGLVGQIGHKCGTRFIRLVFSSSFIIGSFLVAFTDSETPFLAFLGIILFGMSGCGLLFTNLQLSYLFSRGRTIVCGLMTGAFDSSIATQLYLKIAYDNGVLRKYCYIFLGCLHFVTFISTFLWMPKMYIELPKAPDLTLDVNEEQEQDSNMKMFDTNENIEDEIQQPLSEAERSENDEGSLRSHVCSPLFMMHIFWYSVLQLRFLYFVGTLNPWLERISDNEEEVSRFTDVSMYCMMGGIVSSIVAGLFFDCQKEHFKGCKTESRRQLGPVVLPLTVGSLLGVVVSVMQMIQSKVAVYASFVSLTVFRSFLYAIGNGYLSAMFPSKYFSALSGLLMILTGSASFLQYAFFSWTESYENAYFHVDIFLICMVVSSLVHPIYHWWQSRKTNKKDDVM